MLDKTKLTKEEKRYQGKLRVVKKNAEKQSELGYCLLCNKPIKNYCNTHTVPQFVLNNIADSGHVMSSVTSLDVSPIDAEFTGINKTGTIKRICTDCDNLVFQDYEKPDKLAERPSDNVLNSIALKIALHMYSKKLLENGMLDYGATIGAFLPVAKTHVVDKSEWKNTFHRLNKAVRRKKYIQNKLVYWEKLNYVVPIACQISVVLYGDLEGRIVNNVFDNDKRHKMQSLYILEFPFESSSIVMLYHDITDTNIIDLTVNLQN